jgi:hypothetical protein
VTKPTLDLEDELDSANPDQTPDLSEVESDYEVDDLWDGRSSKASLAYPVLRNHEIVGPGSPCIDCKAAGKLGRTEHQFHLRTSKDKAGEWHGPETSTLEFLRTKGYLRNTAQATERAEEQAQLDLVRGVAREAACRTCRSPIGRDQKGELLSECPVGHRNGMPELRAWTTKELHRVLDRDLKGGIEGLQASEKGLRREETERLREAAGEIGRDIAAAIKEALKQ